MRLGSGAVKQESSLRLAALLHEYSGLVRFLAAVISGWVVLADPVLCGLAAAEETLAGGFGAADLCAFAPDDLGVVTTHLACFAAAIVVIVMGDFVCP